MQFYFVCTTFESVWEMKLAGKRGLLQVPLVGEEEINGAKKSTFSLVSTCGSGL